MPNVTVPSPVVVAHPLSGQFVTLAKGQHFDDGDPIVATFAWAFEQPVEQASAAPGEKRAVSRAGKPKAV